MLHYNITVYAMKNIKFVCIIQATCCNKYHVLILYGIKKKFWKLKKILTTVPKICVSVVLWTSFHEFERCESECFWMWIHEYESMNSTGFHEFVNVNPRIWIHEYLVHLADGILSWTYNRIHQSSFILQFQQICQLQQLCLLLLVSINSQENNFDSKAYLLLLLPLYI